MKNKVCTEAKTILSIKGFFVWILPLEEMLVNVVKRILQQSNPELRKNINDIFKYHEDSASSIMTTEFMDFEENMTVQDALKRIRHTGSNKEMINDAQEFIA